MIYEAEPERIVQGKTDSRLITVSAYLKGLHHGDRPTELMPRDAIFLKAARRFYNTLSPEDRDIIDSYSSDLFCSGLNPKQRSRRFHELAQLMIYQMDQHNYLKPPEQAEKGTEFNEPHQRNLD